MNTTIKLAVASALLAVASSANAGIMIPAGDWTIDIGGNVNAYATWTDADPTQGAAAPVGGIAAVRDATGGDTQSINTGLLPSWLSLSGKTRQNDLDVQWLISMQPNVSDNGGAGDVLAPLNRQAFFSFGDASWGSVKLGKDIGIFAQDAILNDMTLLGVGGGSGNSGTATTLGGIGTGYIYAAWKGQIAYTTPNMNGFSATVGITNPNQGFGTLYQDRFGLEGKASYAWTGDLAGKVWVSGASYDVTSAATVSYEATALDIGVAVTAADFGLTAYYYNGDGAGTTIFGANGATALGAKRDSDGGYIQATYTLPTKTKIGVAYGVSNLDLAAGETIISNPTLVAKNDRVTVGAYHPLTKHVNLVAEFNRIKSEGQLSTNNTESNAFSLGGILFF